MKKLHLVRYEHDVATESWCGEDCQFGRNAFATPQLATCESCLEAADAYGQQVARRLADLRVAKHHGVELP